MAPNTHTQATHNHAPRTSRPTPVTHITQVVGGIIEKDGVMGLMGRGLGTKLVTNGIQGILFSVLWRLGQVRFWFFVLFFEGVGRVSLAAR